MLFMWFEMAVKQHLLRKCTERVYNINIEADVTLCDQSS